MLIDQVLNILCLDNVIEFIGRGQHKVCEKKVVAI